MQVDDNYKVVSYNPQSENITIYEHLFYNHCASTQTTVKISLSLTTFYNYIYWYIISANFKTGEINMYYSPCIYFKFPKLSPCSLGKKNVSICHGVSSYSFRTIWLGKYHKS